MQIWPLIVLIVIVIFILIIIILWCGREHGQVQPTGWLLEAWGRNDRWEDTCGEQEVTALYRNISGRNMTINIEVKSDGDCTVIFSTTANPGFMSVLPGRRAAIALPLANNDTITYNCQRDESGEDCQYHVRIQKL